MSAKDGQGDSPRPKTPTEHTPTDGEKSESSGDPRAVPYHRFQEVAWKNRELETRVQETDAQLASLKTEMAGLRARPPADDPDMPDLDIDPVGYAQWTADQAKKESASAKEQLEEMRAETRRTAALNGMYGEFNSALEAFPHLAGPDYRDFAWEQFCIMKDRSQGKASGQEVLQTLDSMLSSYNAEPVDDAARERKKLRGKPASPDTGDVRRVERTTPVGERAPLQGKKSLRQKMDARLGPLNKAIMERFRATDKRTEGL